MKDKVAAWVDIAGLDKYRLKMTDWKLVDRTMKIN